ncbi:hypothetical protein [Methylobacterium sp. ARG-1]|uniref:hypothetical protein n=1 Tax=Methylobacterium sp. ARG-1 TaxID=1692501 RepID=UPI00067FDB2E|nr:hypothetical protein [Methylobacterium sp. ARG-1]KNY23381.1 hypothetical protein AKJ13_06190 [Methylobacterium sp. ARG-1]
MSFRALAILVTLCTLGMAVLTFAEEPDRLWIVAGKLGEGGMWTALAIFIGIAALLGYRRRAQRP